MHYLETAQSSPNEGGDGDRGCGGGGGGCSGKASEPKSHIYVRTAPPTPPNLASVTLPMNDYVIIYIIYKRIFFFFFFRFAISNFLCVRFKQQRQKLHIQYIINTIGYIILCNYTTYPFHSAGQDAKSLCNIILNTESSRKHCGGRKRGSANLIRL